MNVDVDACLADQAQVDAVLLRETLTAIRSRDEQQHWFDDFDYETLKMRLRNMARKKWSRNVLDDECLDNLAAESIMLVVKKYSDLEYEDAQRVAVAVMHRKCHEEYRVREPEVPLGGGGQAPAMQLRNRDANIDDVLILREILEKGLTVLTKKARAVLLLRLYEGYTADEAAAILEMSHGAVDTALSRAVAKLQCLFRSQKRGEK